MTKAKKTKKRTQVGKPSRERFVDEFMIDRNATQAAIRAGYSEKTAGSAGHRLLKTAEILAEINRRGAEQSQRLGVTADRIMQEYERLAMYDPLDFFNADGSMKALADIPEDARRAIGGIEIRELKESETDESVIYASLKKIKLSDKKGALDSLAKIMGLMKDRVEITGEVTLGKLLGMSKAERS